MSDTIYRMRKKLLYVFLLIISLLANTNSSYAIAPAAAGILSIIPGLGQVSAGRPMEGLAWFTSILALSATHDKWARAIGFELWQYNLYDAYRDAGARDTGKQTFLENEIAFLNPANLIDPISVGVIGSGVYAGTRNKNITRQGPKNTAAGILLFSTVGLGEEGLFRGFLFPGFSHLTNSYFVGAVMSSAVFAAAHMGNKSDYYRSSRGLLTIFTGGMLFCLQTYQQKWDLRHSIFTHAWFDIAIEYASISSPQDYMLANAKPSLRFNLSF